MPLSEDFKTMLHEQSAQGERLARIETRLAAIDRGVAAGADARWKCQAEVFARLGRAEKVLAVVCAVPAIVAAAAGAVWGVAKALKGFVVAAIAWLTHVVR